jgi:hypothetical protein
MIPAGAVGEADAIARLQSAGADIVSLRVLADTVPAAGFQAAEAARQALASTPVSVGVRFDRAPGDQLPAPIGDLGVSYVAGGPLQALASAGWSGTPCHIAQTLTAYRRLDEWCAAANNPRVIREIGSPPVLAPPAVLLLHLLTELSLSLSAGVRSFVVNYQTMGNLVQDVAAVRAMRKIAEERAASAGSAFEILTSVSVIIDPLGTHAANSYGEVSATAIAAGLSNVDQVIVSAGSGHPTSQSAVDAVVDGVASTRQMVDMLVDQELEMSQELEAELAGICADLRSHRDLLGQASQLSAADFTTAMSSGGLLGSFPQSARYAIRDRLGAVRQSADSTAGAWEIWGPHAMR